MLACIVNYRFHLRLHQPHLFLPVPPTPLFPSPLLSPLLPVSYSHTYTTATHQLLCHQSLTPSFSRDGRCTPLSHFGSHLNPTRQELAPVFSCTSRDSFCNPFVFKFIQEWVGCTPLPQSRLPIGSGTIPTFNLSTCKPANRLRFVPAHYPLSTTHCPLSLCYARSPLGGRYE
jgi:hypothetical protein